MPLRATDFWLIIAAIVTGVLLTLAGMRAARAHDGYEQWRIPLNGGSCCNDHDCRPTRALQDMDGRWKAWNGEDWQPVPPAAVLSIPSPDGRSHVCINSRGEIPCFVPAPAMR